MSTPRQPPSGLQRRRTAAAAPTSETTDLEAGVVRATGVRTRYPRAKAAADMIAGRNKNVPTATTFTPLFGLLAPFGKSIMSVNKEHAGPKNSVDLLEWIYPSAQDYIRVAPVKERALVTAQQEVASTREAMALYMGEAREAASSDDALQTDRTS